MSSSTKFIVFDVPVDVYKHGVTFCITKDRAKASKFVKERLKFAEEDLIGNSGGKCFYLDGFYPIIWMPDVPKTPYQRGVAAHEILHATFIILHYVNIFLDEDCQPTHEAYCYLNEHLTEGFYENIKKLR